MRRFAQLHILTAYPPSNLNRDDLGRPKTATVGGTTRLRISSQSLKRAWRMSDLFAEQLDGYRGTRTKELGRVAYRRLVEKGVSEEDAVEWSRAIAGDFGKLKSGSNDDPLSATDIEQLAHLGPEELAAVIRLSDTLAQGGRAPSQEEIDALLVHQPKAVDIALFGRMLAAKPSYNVEAAAQVAHAFTADEVQVEDDFFTAVDDLNEGIEDVGAGHMGEVEFGSGVFYLYVCVDRHSLVKNLGGDESLARKALRVLAEAAATVAPTGKQNTFASRACASYVLCEVGDQQPRTLAAAFFQPIGRRSEDSPISDAIQRLESTREKMATVYGPGWDGDAKLDAHAGAGSLAEVLDRIAS